MGAAEGLIMARLTERMRFFVPVEMKAEWKRRATERGMSLSAFLRDNLDDLLAEYHVELASAELERQGATLQ